MSWNIKKFFILETNDWWNYYLNKNRIFIQTKSVEHVVALVDYSDKSADEIIVTEYEKTQENQSLSLLILMSQ